jgi:ABC-type antimicrobial peptide transport system permease subunit
MIKRCAEKSRLLNWFVLASFFVLAASPGTWAMGAAGAAGGAADSGSISGFVYAKDVKTPVAGAVVKIRSLADMKEMASPPTDANGMYTIAEVPQGRYVLGVSAGKEDFNLDYVIYVKAGELGKLSLSLAAGTAAGGGQESGETKVTKKGFFNSLVGRALIVAAVGVGLYFLINEHETSPIR